MKHILFFCTLLLPGALFGADAKARINLLTTQRAQYAAMLTNPSITEVAKYAIRRDLGRINAEIGKLEQPPVNQNQTDDYINDLLQE